MIDDFGHYKCESSRWIDRFWSKIDIKLANECWEWEGLSNQNGYGYFIDSNNTEHTHIVVWKLTYGPIPKDTCVYHTCDNLLCCNPKHLGLLHIGFTCKECHQPIIGDVGELCIDCALSIPIAMLSNVEDDICKVCGREKINGACLQTGFCENHDG